MIGSVLPIYIALEIVGKNTGMTPQLWTRESTNTQCNPRHPQSSMKSKSLSETVREKETTTRGIKIHSSEIEAKATQPGIYISARQGESGNSGKQGKHQLNYSKNSAAHPIQISRKSNRDSTNGRRKSPGIPEQKKGPLLRGPRQKQFIHVRDLRFRTVPTAGGKNTTSGGFPDGQHSSTRVTQTTARAADRITYATREFRSLSRPAWLLDFSRLSVIQLPH